MYWKHKWLRVILAIVLAITFLSITALADYNGSGAGGGWGSGSGENAWNGADGVRVSVVSITDGTDVVAIQDFTNYNMSAIPFGSGPRSVDYAGMGYNKFQYKKMGLSSFKIEYSYSAISPDKPLPEIIGGNPAAVRDYFLDKGSLDSLCSSLGITKDILTTGNYFMVIEPIAYFKYDGECFGLTATEAAMFNSYLIDNGTFVEYSPRKMMGNLTHQNLPAAMYLEKSELGIPAYGGAVRYFTDREIISTLGINILSAKDFTGGGGGVTPITPPDKGKPEGPDDKPGVPEFPNPNPPPGESSDAIIPADHLNIPKYRKSPDEEPDVSVSNLVSGPTFEGPYGISDFSASNITHGEYRLNMWYMKDWALVNRGAVSIRPTELAVAGQVHGSVPSSVSWINNILKVRPTPARVYDNYGSANVETHVESMDYSYRYKVDEGEWRARRCTCSVKPCTVDHGERWVSNWVTYTYDSSFSVLTGDYNYSAKNTVFNDPVTVNQTAQHTYGVSGYTAKYTAPSGDMSTYKFFPYYAMQYYDSAMEDAKPLWMLATGERTLNTMGMIEVSVKTDGETAMITPWSRDKYDIGNKPSTVLNVVKSGSAAQIIPPNVRGTVKYTYYDQDPGFQGAKGDIVIKPDAISAFESIFRPEAMDLAVYSNVPLTASKVVYDGRSIDLSINNDIVPSGTISSYKQKPRPGALNVNKYIDLSSIKVTVTRNNSLPNTQATCFSRYPSSVSISGRTVPIDYYSGKLKFMDALNPNSSLLKPGKDIHGNTLPWYKEEYEGIFKVEIEGNFAMTEDTTDQTWFEIYPYISDWRSGYNTKPNGIQHRGATLYSGTDYVFGVGVLFNPRFTPGGDIIYVPTPAHTIPFQIRGSVFDNTK